MVYPCFCSRRQIRIEVEQAGRAPHGPSGETLYPGICRDLDPAEGAWRIKNGEPYALRLDVAKALARTGPLDLARLPRRHDRRPIPLSLGDVVLARKDVPTSYHLAVTVDDHLQGVTLVTRGEDLFHATHMHRLLQALLGLRTPRYYHHNLIADSSGQRLAKRNRAITLRHLRDCRRTPDDVWRMIGSDDGTERQGALIAARWSLALLLLLAACTVPPAPQHGHAPDLVTDWSPPGTPRAVIVALHGFNDYSRRRSPSSAATPPRTASWSRPTTSPASARSPIAAAGRARRRWSRPWTRPSGTCARRYPAVPLFVLGESMGGAVAMVALARAAAPPVAGLILVAPAVWNGAGPAGLLPDRACACWPRWCRSCG